MKWMEHEIRKLIAFYADVSTHALAKVLGRSERQVYQKALGMGLRKSATYLASPVSGRIRPGAEQGWSSRFPKGHTPWNKGVRFVAGGRSAETRFKPGNRPHTWAPVGSTRITDEGYLQRKVSDTGYTPRDWKCVHVLVWEEANGPVPAGHMVVFRDKDKTHIELSNLELISRAENMRRNSYHRYPKDIARAIQLRGALLRQINKREAVYEKQA